MTISWCWRPARASVAGAVRCWRPGRRDEHLCRAAARHQGRHRPGLVVNKGIRFTGTSGSAIRDLRNMLDRRRERALDPNLSVAAISGLGDVKKGLEGVVHQAFTGKVVIYPQILDFPLTTWRT